MAARLVIPPEQLAREWMDMALKVNEGLQRLQKLAEADVAIARTAKETIYRDGPMALYRYTPQVDKPLGVPVLLVYALVGRYNVVDLQPGRSFVEKLLQLGLDVYAIDWGHPSRADRWLTLDDHVNVLIDDCVDVIRERHHIDKINLLSICQGGVFNLCYTALHPEKVKNLVLTVTPVDFHSDLEDPEVWRGFVNVWTRACTRDDIDLTVDALGNLPGPLTGFAFAMMSPISGMTKYSSELIKLLGDEQALLNFLRMEKWLYDQPDHPGEAGREWLQDLYQANKLFKNELYLDGRHVDLKRVTVPVLNVYAEHDHVVPPPCARALRSVIGSSDYTEHGFAGGHIGVFVGSKSQKVLAPTIADWLKARA